MEASLPKDVINRLVADSVQTNANTIIINNILENLVSMGKGDLQAYLYKEQDGQLQRIADSRQVGAVPYSDEFDTVLERKQFFVLGKTLITGWHSNKYGSWRTVLIPIKSKKTGKATAVLGVDMLSNQWGSFIGHEFINSLLLTLISLLLVLFLVKLQNNNRKLKQETDEHRSALEKIRLFANALKSVNQMVSITSMDNKLIFVNEAFLNVNGYSEKEVLGNPILMAISPKNSQELLGRIIPTTLAGGWNGELIGVRRDGSELAVHLSTSVIYDGNNQPLAIVGVAADVTAQKREAELLMQSEERFRLAAKATRDVIWERELSTNKMWRSDNFGTVFGWSNSESENTDQEAVNRIHPDDRERVADNIYKFFASNDEFWQDEYRYQRKDGTYAWVLDRAFLQRDSSGNPIRVIGALQDQTEKKLAELELIRAKEKAEESDRLKTAFLQNISHEVRTPLNAILGFTKFLSNPNLTPEKRDHFVNIIDQSGTRLHTIVSDIMCISNLQAGQEVVKQSVVQLNEMLARLQEEFSFRANVQNVELHFKPTDTGATIFTDEAKLVQVATKLLDNALKFTPQGSIEVGYGIRDGMVEFSVRDTGIGIPKNLYQSIFNRFQQADTTSTRSAGGAGLGLSISKAYVELMGGQIWLESEEGKGSTFYFTIPYRRADGAQPVKAEPSIHLMHEGASIKTVLAVEDDSVNLMLLNVMLTSFNLQVVSAKNGLEAVEICRANPSIDLVLMDIKMPVMDGCEATKQIRQFLPDLPIIAQTAYALENDRDEILACGCSDYISKPVRPADLHALVNKYLKRL